MSFREKIFIDKLFKDAKITLDRIMRKRRHTFWGETPILFRVRKYKIAGEIRNQRVGVVRPEFHKVRLFSQLLNKRIELQTTPQMLRFIEASGGLDEYLLKTPDEKLMSDVASQLKVQVLQAEAERQQRQALASQDLSTGTSLAASTLSSRSQGEGTTSTGKSNETKKSPAELAKLQRAREELAVARRERIMRMLQAAAAVPGGEGGAAQLVQTARAEAGTPLAGPS